MLYSSTVSSKKSKDEQEKKKSPLIIDAKHLPISSSILRRNKIKPPEQSLDPWSSDCDLSKPLTDPFHTVPPSNLRSQRLSGTMIVKQRALKECLDYHSEEAQERKRQLEERLQSMPDYDPLKSHQHSQEDLRKRLFNERNVSTGVSFQMGGGGSGGSEFGAMRAKRMSIITKDNWDKIKGQKRKQSSLAGETSAFITKVITKLIQKSKMDDEMSIQDIHLISKLTNQALVAIEDDIASSDPINLIAYILKLIRNPVAQEMIETAGYSIDSWMENPTDLYPEISDFRTTLTSETTLRREAARLSIVSSLPVEMFAERLSMDLGNIPYYADSDDDLYGDDVNGSSDFEQPASTEYQQTLTYPVFRMPSGALQDKLDPMIRLRLRQRLLSGKLTDLPKVESRLIRLFVSSGYLDMREERSIIHSITHTLRNLAEQCNCEFIEIDLNYGVPDDIISEAEMYIIALEEIQRCYDLSPGPFFLGLIGNKYGKQCIPMTLTVEEYENLQEERNTNPVPNAELIEDWYKLDSNAIPPVYVLEPVCNKLFNYGVTNFGPHGEQLRKTAARQWQSIEQKIVKVLQSISTVEANVPEKFIMSLTEMEMHRAVTLNAPYTIFYARHIVDIAKNITDEIAPRYTDLLENSSGQFVIDVKKHKRIELIKDRLEELKYLLTDKCQHQVPVTTMHESRSLDSDEVCSIVSTAQFATHLATEKSRLISVPRASNLSNITAEQQAETAAGADNQYELESVTMVSSSSSSEIDTGVGMNGFNLKQVIRSYECISSLENPLTLQQYNLDFDQIVDIEKKMSVANRAFTTIDSEAYARMIKTDLVKDLTDKLLSYYSNPRRISIHADELEEEVLQHTLNIQQSQVDYVAVDDQLETLKLQWIECGNKPMIISGIVGSGKTTVFSEIAGNIADWYGEGAALVIRFIGLTRISSSLVSLLKSIGLQIFSIYNIPILEGIDSYDNCKTFFADILTAVHPHLTSERPLCIMLHGLARINPENGSLLMSWLPLSFPEHCHVMISVSTDDTTIWQNIQNRFTNKSCYYEMPPLDPNLSIAIMKQMLNEMNRTLTQKQFEVLLRETAKHPWPYNLKCMLWHGGEFWRSDMDPDDFWLKLNSSEIIDRYLYKLERKLGSKFASHSIAYIALVPGGITELELKDALSCDDEVIHEVFSFVDVPSVSFVRLPHLYLARFFHETTDQLRCTRENGIPVYNWKSIFVRQAIKKVYLKDKSKYRSDLYYYCNRVLSQIFYATDGIVKYLNSASSTVIDRMICKRPLTKENTRKLLTLPVVLYNSGPESSIKEEYKSKILCNIQWLITKLKGCSMQEVLADFELIQEDDDDILYVKEILYSSASRIKENPDLLMLEILSRFSKTPQMNSNTIDLMVLQSRALLLFSACVFLCPVFPCIEPANLSMKCQRSGPTHIIGIHSETHILVWGSQLGLQVWNLIPRLHAMFHLVDDIDMQTIVLAPDCGHLYYSHEGYLFKWSVTTGSLVGKLDVTTAVLQLTTTRKSMAIEVKRDPDQLFTAMSVSEDGTKILLRSNAQQLYNNHRGVLIVDAVTVRSIVGAVGKNMFGPNICDSCFYNGKVYLACKSYKDQPQPDRICIFSKPNSDENTVVQLSPNYLQIPLSWYPHTRTHHIEDASALNAVKHMLEETLNINEKGIRWEKKLVDFKVTRRTLCVILFSCDVGYGFAMLVAVKPSGELCGNYRSMEGKPNCLALSKDESTAFIGYKNNGLIEVYYLPAVQLMHTYKAHDGDVLSIVEADRWKLYSTGSDEKIRMFDLHTVLAMDFTTSQSAIFNEQLSQTEEQIYKHYSMNVMGLDVGHVDPTWRKLLVCYNSENCTPIVADVQNGFTALPFPLPSKIETLHKAMFACNDRRIVCLAKLKSSHNTAKSKNLDYQFITIRASKMQVIDHTCYYADSMALSKDREHAALCRHHEKGCNFVTFHLKSYEKVYKFTSRRPIELCERFFVSNDARFIVTVDKDEPLVVVWRMIPCKSTKQTTTEYLSDSGPYDDEETDDEIIDYDERKFMYLFSNDQNKIRRARAAADAIDLRRNHFSFQLAAAPDTVAITADNYLIVGNNTGQVIIIDLEFFSGDLRRGLLCDVLYEHEDAVSTVCTSSAGRYTFTGSVDKTIKVWDNIAREIVTTFYGHTDTVLSIAIGSSNVYAVSGGADHTVRLWHLQSGRLVTTFYTDSDVYSVVLLRWKTDFLMIAALGDLRRKQQLMLFKSYNVSMTNSRENF